MAALGPTILEGNLIRLEPLRLDHAAALWEAGRSPEIWPWMSTEFTSPASAEQFVHNALQGEAAGKEHPFAVIRCETGRVLGSTRYMDVDPVNKSVEIGWTWYSPEVWGTAVNPEAKFLLFRHAFEDWGARRVWLKTDMLNTRSQAAMRKLGARYEGRLRNHRFRRDGSMRDTLVFSVIDAEWPTVRTTLLRRLQSAPALDSPAR